MAYRRKQANPRHSTYEDFRSPAAAAEEPSTPSSLAAQAIRASAAHRTRPSPPPMGDSAHSSSYRRPSPSQDPNGYQYTSMTSLNESRGGFWGVLARKAKSILEDDRAARQLENFNRNQPHMLDTCTDSQLHQFYHSPEGHGSENPTIQKSLDAITSSLNYIGGRVGNALEEGLTIVETRTADIIQETRKMNIRRKGSGPSVQSQASDLSGYQQMQAERETQLKASRDVANAMSAKAKLLMRELKTVKADLAFAKQRCSQLEDENKILRESHEKGDYPEDDDLIRLQLETLLAEKARLAHENSVYSRENRFLREIVEYHQLTMQDVVYLDEGTEEVTEVYQLSTPPSRDHSRSPSPSIRSSISQSVHPNLPSSAPIARTLSPQPSGGLTRESSITAGAILLIAESAPSEQGSVSDVPVNTDANFDAHSVKKVLDVQQQQQDISKQDDA